MNRRNWSVFGLSLLVLMTVSVAPLLAQDTWKGDASASGTLFSNNASWNQNRPPNAGEALIFSSTNLAAGATLVNDLTGLSVGNITYNAGAPALTISGNKFANTAINNQWYLTNNSGVLQTIAANVDFSTGGMNYSNGNTRGSLTFSGTVTATVNSSWNVGDMVGGTLTFNNFVTDRVLDWWGRNPKGAATLATDYVGANRPTVVFGNLTNLNGSANAEIRQAGISYKIVINGENTGVSFVLAQNADLLLDYTSSAAAKMSAKNSTIRSGVVRLAGGNYADSMGTLAFGGGNLNNGSTGGVLRFERAGAGSSTLKVENFAARYDRSVVDIGEENLIGNQNGSATNITNWLTLGNDHSAGRDWAVIAGAGAGYADKLYVAYSDYGSITTANSNALLTGAHTLAAGTTINSLKINTDAAGQALDLGASTLILSANGLLFVGADDYNITAGAGMLRSGNGNQEIVLWQSGAGKLTVSATLGVGSGGFTKAGTGVLEITAANNYTGATALDAGKLIMGHDLAFGSATDGQFVMSSGTLDLNGHNLYLAAFLGGGYGDTDVGAAVINSGAQPVTLSIGGSASTVSRRTGAAGIQNVHFSAGINLILSGTVGASLFNPNDNNSVTFVDTRRTGPTAAWDAYDAYSVANASALAASTGTVIFAGNGGFRSGNSNKMDNFTQSIVVTGTGNAMLFENPNLTLSGKMSGDGELSVFARNNNHYTRLNGDMSAFTGTVVHVNTGAYYEFVRFENAAAAVDSGALVIATTNPNSATYIEDAATGATRIRHLAELSTRAADVFGVALAGGTLGNVIFRNMTNNSTLNLEVERGDFAGSITNYVNIASDADRNNHLFTDNNTTNVIALTKTGEGTLTLSGTNTYTGTTTVSGGVLLVNGSGALTRTERVAVINSGTFDYVSTSALAKAVTVSDGGVLLNRAATNISGAVTLGANGVLAGNDTVDFAFTAAAGAHLAPGFGSGDVDTLTISSGLTLGNFVYDFDLASAASHDLLNFSGGLTLNGSAYTLNINPLAGFDADTNFDSVVILSGLTNDYTSLWNTTDSRFTLTVSGGDLLLSYSAVPEPSTWLLLGLGSATLLLTLRRRK